MCTYYFIQNDDLLFMLSVSQALVNLCMDNLNIHNVFTCLCCTCTIFKLNMVHICGSSLCILCTKKTEDTEKIALISIIITNEYVCSRYMHT